MWLLTDFEGAASKKPFGKKGDEVAVLSQRGDMYLVKNGSNLFFVKENRLSKIMVKRDPVIKK